MYQHTLNTCFPYQCFWNKCLFDSFDILMILITITFMIRMIILLMINILILYICAISSFLLHITCFPEWTCELCDAIFHCERNYECHKKICCGMNAYQCDLCGKVYCSKKGLCGHKRKHHTDDECYFVFLYRVWTIWISHMYDVHMNWEFFMIYMILYSSIERRIWVMKEHSCQMNHCLMM